MKDIFSASEGKNVRWVMIEESGSTIYRYPIPLTKYPRLTTP